MIGGVYDLDNVGRQAVTDEADVVIIGTGAGGATAARVLAEAGLDVVMIEEGPAPPQRGFRQDAYTAFKGLWRDLGFQVARGRTFMPILQGRAVGGTTVINGAIIHRLPEKIHAAWAADGAVDELLAFDALEKVFDQLDDELSVGPAPESVLGGNAASMRTGVERIGARGNRIRRAVADCQGAARCNQGCPTARKQSMHVTYVPRAIRAGARVYATCRAERILLRGDRAVGVEGRFRQPVGRKVGPTLRVTAKRAVIVAASAVQTPVLLQRSGIAHDLLGRRFQAHPGTSVMGRFDRPIDMWFGATQGYETTHFWEERMKFESVTVPTEIGAARLPGFGRALMAEVAGLGHVAQWGVQVRAEAKGRVRGGLFGGTDIHYDLTAEDVARYRTGIEKLVEMMFAAGAKEVYPGVHGLPERIASVDEIRPIRDLPDDPRRFHFIAAHLFGTTAMHRDPRKGVVRPDGRTHAVERLFVADSSVFPTNLGVNPQHPISAISWRIAERIAGG